MGKIIKVQSLIFLLLLNVVTFRSSIFACATAAEPGKYLRVNSEHAVIIWDEKTQTEHFIRRGDFSSSADDFGFLVPTPTVPQISETSNEFSFLSEMTKPEEIEKKIFKGFDFSSMSARFLFTKRGEIPTPVVNKEATAKSDVRVLEQKKVAGYDAVVLEADNETSLIAWLTKNGYKYRSEMKEWLKVYVEAHWKLTAFKVSGKDQDKMSLTAVRLSFKTDSPYYPYHEPATTYSDENRKLNIWFIGNQKVNGTIGKTDSKKWAGEVIWSGALSSAQREQIASNYKLPVDQIPARLTEFIDKSSPRPGTDELFFAAETDQSSVKPPPNVQTIEWKFKLPIDLAGLFLMTIFTGIIWQKRRRRLFA